MAETNDENDPFEEDIIFDQTDLLHADSRAYHSLNISQRARIMPRFFLFIRTISLCVAFIGLGLCASLGQGPIIKFENLHGMDISLALHIFTAYSVGMLIGGILGSWLFEKYNRQFLICMCLLCIGIFIGILPFAAMSSFVWTLFTLVALGAGLSFMFTGGNVLCLDMWGKKGPGYLVAVHFSFALGAFITTTVIHPFIMNSNLPTLTNSTNLLHRNPRSIFLNTNKTNIFPQSNKYDPVHDQHGMSNTAEQVLGANFPYLQPKSYLESTSLLTDAPHNHGVPHLSPPVKLQDIDRLTPQLPNINDWVMNSDKYSPSNVTNRDSKVTDGTHLLKNKSVSHKPATFSNGSSNDGKLLDLLHSYKHYGITGMHVAYILVGVFMLMNSVISLIFLCITPREPRSKQIDGTSAMLNNHYITLFTVSFAVYMFSTEAVQGSVHHFLAESSLISKNNEGQAVFWGLICSVRFLCIFLTGCCQMRPQKILLGCNFIMLLGTILVCVGTFDKHDFLFGGIVVIAIGIAPVLPTCFLWMSNIMKVTHKMCAFMIIISSTGNSVTHTSLTQVSSDSHLYAYIMVTISICSILFLFLSLYMGAKLKAAMESCFRDCTIAHQFDDEEGLSMLVSEQRDTNREIPHRLSEVDEFSQALLID